MRKIDVLSLCLAVSSTAVASAGVLDTLPPVKPDGSADRATIPAVYRWDLTDLYPDDAAWSAAFSAARDELDRLAGMHARLAEPVALARYLDGYYRLELDINRLTLYADLQADAETTNQTFIARHQQALNLTNQIMEEGSTLRQKVLALSGDELAAAYAAAPELERFRPAIDGLRRRASRMLGAEAERVLALAGDNLWAVVDLNELPSPVERSYQALQSELPLPAITDEQGARVQLTLANYVRFRASADRRVRREAVTALLGTLRSLENTFAATLAGQAQLNVFMARARHYDSALEAYLDKDDLDPAVYHTLIQTVRARTPALHRYVDLRRRAMGIDEVHLYDLYVPIVAGVDRDIRYAEGARMILDALAPLGDAYRQAVARLLDPATGCVDVYPSKDKESGAFSSSVYGVHPFIKMNYQDRYDDVSTLAHELGHAVHTHLSNSMQPYLTSRYVMFLAEVASTCNEVLLSEYAVDHAASKGERAWLLAELAETIRTTIYRQTLFAEFELEVNRMAEAGEPITAERLNALYAGLIREYYGPGFTIEEDDAVEWAYIPHLYYKYYVFAYATGMSSGIAIAQRVSNGVPGAREAYLEMLSAGNSKPPLELLANAGVDLTKPDAIAAALDLFDRTVTELEKLLAE